MEIVFSARETSEKEEKGRNLLTVKGKTIYLGSLNSHPYIIGGFEVKYLPPPLSAMMFAAFQTWRLFVINLTCLSYLQGKLQPLYQ